MALKQCGSLSMVNTFWTPSREEATDLTGRFDSPAFIYDAAALEARANAALAFPHPFGLTVRYAMKAASNATILRRFDRLGLHFDASSGWEAERVIRAGIDPVKVSLSTQELPPNVGDLLRAGVSVNACSLNQLRRIGESMPGHSIGLRVNPGLGSGSTNRTNVGGPASSFGIWHEHLDQAREIADGLRLRIFRIHTHIGSGSDPAVWQRVVELTLQSVARFPDVTHINMGGGYKVARMPGESSTDLQQIGTPVRDRLTAFAAETGRKLHLEIEPGTFLMANVGGLLCKVQDIVDTGERGYRFLKLDTGMTDILRPSLYGAQHPIEIIPQDEAPPDTREYVVVGHCCESGDILTPAPGDPEGLGPRALPEARIGDFCWIGGAGAYCAAMCAANYNSFPTSAEVWRETDGCFHLIRRRQTMDQIVANEIHPN